MYCMYVCMYAVSMVILNGGGLDNAVQLFVHQNLPNGKLKNQALHTI